MVDYQLPSVNIAPIGITRIYVSSMIGYRLQEYFERRLVTRVRMCHARKMKILNNAEGVEFKLKRAEKSKSYSLVASIYRFSLFSQQADDTYVDTMLGMCNTRYIPADFQPLLQDPATTSTNQDSRGIRVGAWAIQGKSTRRRRDPF
jgi:hypothetical protein